MIIIPENIIKLQDKMKRVRRSVSTNVCSLNKTVIIAELHGIKICNDVLVSLGNIIN